MKSLIAGASISFGHGLSQEKLDVKLWANRLLKNIDNCDISDIENVSISGDDNFQIFKKASIKLMKEDYKSVIVCWQDIPRTNYFFGLEKYNTQFDLLATNITHDIKLVNNICIPKSQLINMQKNIIAHYNHHWDLSNLVFYVNSLIHVAEQKKSKIRFVNYDLPWNSYKFFDKVAWKTPDKLDPFTRYVLQSEVRDDVESNEIYQMIHNDYANLGGIQEKYWLNLYDPLRRKQTDNVSSDDKHPGYQSQDMFTDFLTQCYSESLTINKKPI